MSISWKPDGANSEFELKNVNNKWQWHQVGEGTTSTLEQLLLKGGTLKIGDTSIQIPDKSLLSDNIPALG